MSDKHNSVRSFVRPAVRLAAGAILLALLSAPGHVPQARTITITSPSDGGSPPVPLVRLSIPEIGPDDWGPNPDPDRVMVFLNTGITEPLITDLASYGVIHGWVPRYRLVAMTPQGGDRATIGALPYVASVDDDAVGYLTSVGSWDRDMLDIVDVEESGVIGDPDLREVAETGAGVHVAVIDTGLVTDWRFYLPEDQVATQLARSFVGPITAVTIPPVNGFDTPSHLWETDFTAHGTAVASHIIGFRINGLFVDGAAPGAKVIPLHAFFDQGRFGNESVLVAAIDYVMRLVESGTIGPAVINMSLSFRSPRPALEQAINDAIAAGIIIVAAAGNFGEAGMGWPGAYPQVISAGAVSWTKRFRPGTFEDPNFDFWWNLDVGFDPDPRRGPAEESEAFVTPFSSRALQPIGQELDVLAPGQATVAPKPFKGWQSFGTPYFFVGGTSFSSPLTAGVAALMLEKNPQVRQSDVEAILKATSLPMNPIDSRSEVIIFPGVGSGSFSWDDDCNGIPCDPVGAGLLQADAAIAGVPNPAHGNTGSLATGASAAATTVIAETKTDCSGRLCNGGDSCCVCGHNLTVCSQGRQCCLDCWGSGFCISKGRLCPGTGCGP